MTNRFLRRLLVVLGAIGVLALVAFGPQVVGHFTRNGKSSPPLATASLNSFPVVAKASGTLFPQSLLYVDFATSGQLTEVDVHVGDTVTSGQRLAALDQSAATLAVTAAQEARNAAIAARNNATNSQQLAAANAQLANADQQLQKAQTDLNNTVLTAPEGATVLEINSQVGESISAGSTRAPTLPGSSTGIIDPNLATSTTPFIKLGSPTAYQVSAAFSESNASQLKVGQVGNVVFDAIPGLSIPAHVVAIADSATLVSQVPQYYAAIDAVGTDSRLRSGMTVNVSVTVAQADNKLTVPNQALLSIGGQQYVNVWYKESQVLTAVTTGLIGDKLTEITSGLTEGQQVVLTAGSTIPTASASPG